MSCPVEDEKEKSSSGTLIQERKKRFAPSKTTRKREDHRFRGHVWIG